MASYHDGPTDADGPGAAAGRSSTGVCGSCAPAPSGPTYPSGIRRTRLAPSAHRRFQRWSADGTLERVLEALATDLKERGGLDLSECFIDGTFKWRRKGQMCGKNQAGQRFEAHGHSWALADRFGLPLAVRAASASPHEVTLVAPSPPTLDSRFVTDLPQRLIGDRAYDADPLDAGLAALGVEMIAPQRRNRKKPKTQDGRRLRRYQRRWKVERLFAWRGNFRRLVVRYERHALNFLGFVHLGCILILLRVLLRQGLWLASRHPVARTL